MGVAQKKKRPPKKKPSMTAREARVFTDAIRECLGLRPITGEYEVREQYRRFYCAYPDRCYTRNGNDSGRTPMRKPEW